MVVSIRATHWPPYCLSVGMWTLYQSLMMTMINKCREVNGSVGVFIPFQCSTSWQNTLEQSEQDKALTQTGGKRTSSMFIYSWMNKLSKHIIFYWLKICHHFLKLDLSLGQQFFVVVQVTLSSKSWINKK
jgi:hypothetical protein